MPVLCAFRHLQVLELCVFVSREWLAHARSSRATGF